jgi:hypothetical protein
MESHSDNARSTVPRSPRAGWIGAIAMLSFGAVTLFGIHGRAHAVDTPEAPVVVPEFLPDSGSSPSASGRRRSTVTDPLWDDAVTVPSSGPPNAAPGGFHP